MRLILLLALFILSGCKADVAQLIENTGQLTVQIYNTGKPVKRYTINKGSEKYNTLMKWAIANDRNWSVTPATYVPGILVSSNNFSLNFLGENIIVNYQEGQFIKSTNIEDYAFLLQ